MLCFSSMVCFPGDAVFFVDGVFSWRWCVFLAMVCFPGDGVFSWRWCVFLAMVCFPGDGVFSWRWCFPGDAVFSWRCCVFLFFSNAVFCGNDPTTVGCQCTL